jgi:alpha-D-ribose 1-methylphosphonate 5-triphosphate synthase subunit PhnG
LSSVEYSFIVEQTNRQLLSKLYIMTQSQTEKFVEPSSSVSGDRKAWISVLSKAKSDDVIGLWERAAFPDLLNMAQVLRPPEIGMVMVRGRAGGAGSAFNLGEMTVTRCAIRLEGGETGIGYVTGRNKQHAKIAAVVDAMMQSPAHAQLAKEKIVTPLETAAANRSALISRKAKATQVEFFTMVRDRKG